MNINLSFLNSGLSRLKEKCNHVYNNLDGANIKNMYNKIDSNIKNGIMKNIGGIDLYDYTGISEPTYRLPYNKLQINSNNYCEFEILMLKDFLHSFCSIDDDNDSNNDFKTSIDKFLVMIRDEKVVIHYTVTSELINDSKNEGLYTIDYNFVTNYGKLIQFQGIGNHINKKPVVFGKCDYKENEFWIPVDYIKIIRITKPLLINELLQNMKESLCDRKFVPSYVKDIMEENKRLSMLYDEYKTNTIEFEKDKIKFENENKPYIDVIVENEKLVKLRNELDEERNKLKLVKIKLDMDREKLNSDMNKIGSIDVDDILKK